MRNWNLAWKHLIRLVDEGLDGVGWIGFGKRYLNYSSSLRSDEVRFGHLSQLAKTEGKVVVWILPEHLGSVVDPVCITLLQITCHHLARVPEKCVVTDQR